jgi:hypothetical protein
MSEIPADIMQAAEGTFQEILEHAFKPHYDVFRLHKAEATSAIVKAIRIERERCAKIASAEVMRFRAKVGRKYYPGYHEDMRVAISSAVLNHQSDSGTFAHADVRGLASVKATAPLSDRDYVLRVGERSEVERELAAVAAATVSHLGLEDVGGGV